MKKILVAIILIVTGQLYAQQAPYPLSEFIKSIDWELDTKIQNGLGSDQWPMTWAADDNIYAAWGDGWGWTGEIKPGGDIKGNIKRSIGVTKITGMPPNFSGEDLWGTGPGRDFGKPDALIAIDDKILMFWTNGDSKYDHDSYSAVSLDSGKSWTLGNRRLFNYAPAGFRVRGICQFGKGYEGAPDDYIYIYFGLNRHPDIYLARVKKDHIFDAASYEWYAYTKYDGSASWTYDLSKKAVVFHDNNAYLWHLSVNYNPGLKRYLLTKPHFSEGDLRDSVRAPETKISSFGIFDAPTPWGPWTTVIYEENFLDDYVKFNYIIPNKYLSEDGKTFWLGWSGWPEYDNINFIKGHFILHE